MEKVTVFESIAKIFKMIASTPLLIGVLVGTIILLVVISIFHLKNSKSGKIIVLGIFVVTIVLLVAFNISFFVDWLDKIVENFVKIIYFPSWYMYLLAVIYTDVTIFRKMRKSLKQEARKIDIFDYIYFYVFQFLLFMIIQVVTKDNVDIFSTTDLYNNSKLLSLIQISSYIFWIRVLIQLLSFIINKLSTRENDELEVKIKEINKNPKKEKKEDKEEDNSFGSFDDSYFYQEPDYAGKLKEIENQKENAVTNLQSQVFSNNFSDNNKTYDIFNSPKIIKDTKDTQNEGFNQMGSFNQNNNSNNNGSKTYDYDDSNYFDDFFE